VAVHNAYNLEALTRDVNVSGCVHAYVCLPTVVCPIPKKFQALDLKPTGIPVLKICVIHDADQDLLETHKVV
jgi:hypothetical protein